MSTPSHTPKSTHKPHTPHAASSSSSTPFTEAMRDRQARNKDYPTSEDSDSSWDGPSGRFDAYGNDSYSNIQLRRDAAIKLDNPEIVMMLAMARNDSVPATRNYLMNIMCGFTTQEDLEAEEALRDEKGKAAGSGSGSASRRLFSG